MVKRIEVRRNTEWNKERKWWQDKEVKEKLRQEDRKVISEERSLSSNKCECIRIQSSCYWNWNRWEYESNLAVAVNGSRNRVCVTARVTATEWSQDPGLGIRGQAKNSFLHTRSVFSILSYPYALSCFMLFCALEGTSGELHVFWIYKSWLVEIKV